MSEIEKNPIETIKSGFDGSDRDGVCDLPSDGCRGSEHGCCAICSAKRKERSPEEYTRLIHRLNRIEGQVRGIRKMVERCAYCPDILMQTAAVNAALNAFCRELLADHLRTCVADGLRDGDESVIDELTETLRKLMK